MKPNKFIIKGTCYDVERVKDSVKRRTKLKLEKADVNVTKIRTT
tara:strand:+ start:3087 stop:3218 length:132 start_codon:yes stop_codon:yes gene_type:complete